MTTKTDLRKPYTQAHAATGARCHIGTGSVFESSSRVENEFFKEIITTVCFKGKVHSPDFLFSNCVSLAKKRYNVLVWDLPEYKWNF